MITLLTADFFKATIKEKKRHDYIFYSVEILLSFNSDASFTLFFHILKKLQYSYNFSSFDYIQHSMIVILLTIY